MDERKSNAITPSIFGRTFSRNTTLDVAPVDKKGPLGLNTLYDPLAPAIADLIFVHGLGGGSFSTWTESQNGSLDPDLYWPQQWLPKESGFGDVRIHSFGYDSSWTKESTLNIHDFAKSLLVSIMDCPVILKRNSNVPLIFAAHSMGGLVIKKAYIIARASHEYTSIATRTKAMVFMATPHRGSDLAQTFNRILGLSSGARPFVTDLQRNSQTTQSINDEFPALCDELQLYSFYETIPSSLGPSKAMVVERDMATLGYRNERTAYLNADHRHVVKYLSPNDINYKTVRNAIAGIIRSFRPEELVSDDTRDLANLRTELNICLQISKAPGDELMEVESQRVPGSCEWILGQSAFSDWRNSPTSWTYWISASPGTGKSVLCGFVIKHLRDAGLNCSFYFFTHGDKVKSGITSFLLSMAWQMATTQRDIMETVIEIYNDGNIINASTDYRTVWKKLFVVGILRCKLQRRNFWVVDGLDECKEDAELISYLLKVNEIWGVRVFVTHRRRFDAPKHIGTSRVTVYAETIDPDETKNDISLYLRENMQILPASTDDERKDMVNTILEKSAGCFLWVSLVLQELDTVGTLSGTRRILEEIPSGMDNLYSRILTSMVDESRGKEMAKAILHWVVCSARPLTIEELHGALELDLNDTIHNVERSIETTCGQLVYVDKQSRVHVIHETARDYLLRQTESEFYIEMKVGQERLALICLKSLMSLQMVGGNKRRPSSSIAIPKRLPFTAYASKYLSVHIRFTDSNNDEFIVALAGFLSSRNVLFWIEYVATEKDLHPLIWAGRAFAYLLRRRSKPLSLGREVRIVEDWSVDLIRLATKFGKSLSASPSSIFSLIPPFCPLDSAVRRQFGKSLREISVHGLSVIGWDDCLSTIHFPNAYVSALASSDKFFAVGLDTGKINIYYDATCQEANILDHGEAVRLITFSALSNTLATCGITVLKIWSLDSWTQTWKFELSQMCMSVIFAEDDQILLAAMRNNELVEWNLKTGLPMEPVEWTVDNAGRPSKTFRRPSNVSMNAGQGLLAAIYRGQDLLVWDLTGNYKYETYNRVTGLSMSGDSRQNTTISAVVFNPGSTLFASSYFEGDIVVFDAAEGKRLESVAASAQSLASSPDGRTLATFDSSGVIQFLDFETLRVICRIQSRDCGIKVLCFNGDSSRLLVGRGSQCKIWNPPALLRHQEEDNDTDSTSFYTAPQEFKYDNSGGESHEILITAICTHDSGSVFLCGKDDGSVCVYSTKDGLQLKQLYRHHVGASILSLFADATSQIIGSVASSGQIMTHKLSRIGSDWQVDAPLFDHRPGFAIEQIISNAGHTRMLVCSQGVDTLIDVGGGRNDTVCVLKRKNDQSCRWAAHPNNQDLIMITGHTAHIYSWDKLQNLTGETGIYLEGDNLLGRSIESVNPCYNGVIISTLFFHYQQAHRRSNLLLYNTSSFQALPSSTSNPSTATPVPNSHSLSIQVEYLIGSYASRLVFLHASGWICSTEQETFTVTRHFFVPSDWLSSNLELMIKVTKLGDILFVRRDEVAVIKRGLETSEAGFGARFGRRRAIRANERLSIG